MRHCWVLWADDHETATLFTVLGLAITSVVSLGAAYFAYLSNRDRLAFDAKMLRLERAFEECEKMRGEDRARVNELQTRAEAASTAAARMEGQLAGARAELENLRQEVNDLRDRLYGGQS